MRKLQTTKRIIVALSIVLLTSCGNTKYTHHFEKGRMIDFTEGKWMLNRPFTNYKNDLIDNIAAKHFKKILGDSLIRLTKMEKGYLIAAGLPFEASREQLIAAKKATGFDYLINVQSNTGKNEMGSFAHAPSMGSTVDINDGVSKIRIYDLNTAELISQSSTTGIAEVYKSEGDKNWDYVNSASTIAIQSLQKLIRQYRKNGITNQESGSRKAD